MKQKFRWGLWSVFAAIFLLTACAEQQTQPTPEMIKTVTPSSTTQPTSTRAHVQTRTATPTTTPKVQASELCAKNLVPAGLLIFQPEIENKKLIAFSSKFRDVDWHSDIYTVDFDGSRLKRLTNYSGDDKWTRWSPDGKEILFYSSRYQEGCDNNDPKRMCKSFLFIMNADGTNSKRIVPGSPYYPDQSPDGKFIVYSNDFYDELRLVHGLGDYLSNIFIENISGSYKRNITDKFQPAAFGGIDWSPDSKHLAFSGVTEPMVETSNNKYWPVHVYLANANGSNLRRLDEGGAFRDDSYGYQEKTWSSDGKQLAFLTFKGIAIINADGSGFLEHQLENNSYARDIFWLDDNKHIIFTDNNNVFYKIDVDFTNLEKLPLTTRFEKLLYRMQLLKTRELAERDPNHIDYYYELSPNGKWLAYLEHGTFPDNLCRQIRIINTETGENYFVLDREGFMPFLLKNSPNDELKIISSDNLLNSSRFETILWSPDSRQLLFTHSYQGLNAVLYQDLFAINLDGTGLDLIIDDVWNPAIQP